MSSRTIAAMVGATVLFTSVSCGGNNTNTASSASPSPSSSATTSGRPQRHQTNANKAASSPASPAATEFNPPGDIPDSTVYVPFTLSGVQIKVPEGWARKNVNGVS